MKTFTLLSVLLSMMFMAVSYAAEVPLHLDKKIFTNSCATCHFKTNLKSGGGVAGCLTCHGNPQRRVDNRKMPKGSVAGLEGLKNIELEFQKTYRHPVLEASGVHKAHENLPEIDPVKPRHSECVDCHNPHYLSKDNKYAGIRGQRLVSHNNAVSTEAELCYRCHGDSANLPGKYTNKRIEFMLINPSFHPLEGEGKNLAVVSLIRPYRERRVAIGDISTVTCTDCHGSDDPNGIKGVHGSRYRFILKDNFDADDNVVESPQAYALCYRCHARTSILANESFRYHSLHIVGKNSMNRGTSCFTCHNSHGSTEYKYLIRFNRNVVSPNSKGVLKFVEKGSGKFSGECYLSCHGVDHNPKSY